MSMPFESGTSGARLWRRALPAIAALVLAGSAASAARADDGALDTTFGTNGAALATVPGTPAPDLLTINALVRQADGKLYAVGSARFGGSDTRFLVERLLADGRPDVAFGDGGAALVDFHGGLLEDAHSAVLQPDGKLIVAGSFRNAQGLNDPAIARVLTQGPAAGQLDPTFGVAGRVVDTSFEHGGSASPSSAFAAAVSIVPNTTVTRIRIHGPMDYPAFQLWPDMIVATYDLDGTKVSGGTIGTFATVEAAIPRPDGHYAVAGFGAPTSNGGALSNPDSFAIGLDQPNTHIQFPGSTDSHAFALTLTPGGGAVAAGQALINGASRIALAKVRLPVSQGASPVDTSFGTGGRVLTNVFGNARARAILAQPDGKLVVAGTAKNGGNDFFVVVRYNADGSLDASFGGDGVVTTLFPALGGQIPGGIVHLSDGRLVVGGSARRTNGERDVALARYGRGSCTAFLGCVSLVQLASSTILVTADLEKARGVGILVSRVRHGRAKRVGRVPFGHQRAGNIHIRWHVRVRGKRLKPGRYRVRVRALRHGRVVAVSRPIRIRIRH
jgi:uncharacterized delta-60 repeat protein